MPITINLNDVQVKPIVVNADLTAVLDRTYNVVASAIFTDPTPTEGKGFIVFVRNGTATVGGVGYSTAGTVIRRIYHSGAWANYTGTSVDVNTIGAAINGAASGTPNDTDLVMSVDTSVAKKNTWTQIKAFLKTYFDTVYQAAGTYLTSANITQTITNGVTDKAPSEDAVYARFKQVTLFYQRTVDVTYTGFTGNTFLEEVEIPADYLGPNSEIEVSVTFERNSGGTSTNTCFVGLSNTSGSFNSRGYIQMTTAQLQSGMFKRFVFKNGNNIKYQQTSIQTQEFYNTTSTLRNTVTLDRTQPIYVSINGNLGTSTDSIIINEYRIMIYNRA